MGYSASLAAMGGSPPYTWSVASGSLPDGLVLNSVTGAVTGTPTVNGSFNFTVQVTDSSNPAQFATQPFVVAISSVPSSLSAALLRLDAMWDPLRGNPRFESLLEPRSR